MSINRTKILKALDRAEDNSRIERHTPPMTICNVLVELGDLVQPTDTADAAELANLLTEWRHDDIR